MNVLLKIAKPNEFFNFSFQLMIAISVFVEMAILTFIMGGGRLHQVGPLQVLLPFNFHHNVGSGGKERSVVVKFADIFLQL